MLGAGHGEQILVSQTTWQLVHNQLPAGASLRDLGIHRLRDLEEDERIFQIETPDLRKEFPRLKTLPLDWPQPATHLFGRNEDVERVSALLDERRLVTLTGPPGVGKTRLAIEAAAHSVEEFADGVYFVDLSALVDPALVPSTIAKDVGAAEAGGRAPEESLLAHLRAQSALLVLDNFEQVVGAAASVSRLLSTCAGVKVLATSREPLNLIEIGEQRYPVEPLPVPRPGASSPEQLKFVPSVGLFRDEARRINPQFDLTTENSRAVATICQRLDGLPLAIRLAAAWTSSFSPQGILKRLEHRLDLLEGGGPDLPERQRTMRGAVAWSYALLSGNPSHQTVFRLLAVFRGPFSCDALEKVCSMSSQLRREVPRAVRALIEKGLLQQVPSEGGTDLYNMLAVIREYADELLRQNRSEARDAERLHTLWYRGLAQRAAKAHGRTEEDLYRQLEAEHDNLRMILEQDKVAERGLALLELAADLGHFWYRYGYSGEGQSWVELGLRTATSAPPRLRAQASNEAGSLAFMLGDLDGAEARCQEALTLHRAVGNRAGEATALNAMGLLAYDRGQPDRARELFIDALRLHRECKDKCGEAMVLSNLGLALRAMGNDGPATDRYREALRLFRQADNRDGVAWCFEGLAATAWGQGDLSGAARLAGVAEGLRDAAVDPPPQDQLRRIDDLLAPLRDLRGTPAVAAAWAAGRALPLEEAIVEVLGSPGHEDMTLPHDGTETE